MNETETIAPQGPASAAPAAEPLASILAEMGELAHGFSNGEVCATARKVRQWVSRIDAAVKWEHLRDATKKVCDAPEPLSAILAEMRAAAKSTDLFNGEEVGEPLIRGSKVEEYADRIVAAVASDRRKECEQCIRDRIHDEEMKTRTEQMSPAEETDLTLCEMRRAAENGRLAIKANQQARSAIECYVDNTLAYANRLADSITRERRRAATRLSLAKLQIKTLHKQFKHQGELE